MTMPRNRIRELRTVRAGDLKVDPRNWRKHPKAQREALQAMLDRVGWADAVIARETPEGLVLVDGHLRADLDANAEVPVLVVDLDEAEAGQVLATLDPLAAMAEANTEALSKLLQEVTVPIDLGDLFPNLPGLVPELPPAPDDVVEPVADPVTKRGDVWQLGRHRLMCGDSTSAEDVARLLDEAKCDLILTDPPYLHQHLGGEGIASSKSMYHDETKVRAMSDFSLDRHTDLFISAAPMLVAFHSRDLVPDYAALAREHGRSYDLHVWHKANAIPFTHNTWKSDVEYIALLWHRKPGWKQLSQEQHSKVYTSSLNVDHAHPTAKPIPLLRKYIEILDAQRVLDPFAGSGTTLVACEQLNRTCYAMEIDPGYVDAAVKRWEAYTGEKGVLQ